MILFLTILADSYSKNQSSFVVCKPGTCPSSYICKSGTCIYKYLFYVHSCLVHRGYFSGTIQPQFKTNKQTNKIRSLTPTAVLVLKSGLKSKKQRSDFSTKCMQHHDATQTIEGSRRKRTSKT